MASINYQKWYPYTFRDAEQERVFKAIVDNFHAYDVFVIVAPVAFGKTGLAKGILNYANSLGLAGNIMVPDNGLVAQGRQEFPDLCTLGLKSQYGDSVSFHAAQDKVQAAKQAILNPMTLLSSRLYKPVLVMDEAHSYISLLQDMGGMKVWRGSEGYHPGLQDVTQAVLHFAGKKDKQSQKLLKEITKRPEHFCLSYEEEELRGNPTDVLRLYQLSPRYNKPVLWPPHRTRKIFMMSATISLKEVEELGLSDRRVLLIEAKSGIPPERAPIFLDFQGSMTRVNQPETLPKIINRVTELADSKVGERGFIHGTYSVAASMRGMGLDPERFTFHTKWDKREKLSQWLEGHEEKGDSRIFVGSGLTQGLDLKGDKARWQVITKCFSPSMGDPAIRRKMQLDPEWYAWVTIREILQAVGRVARGPDDYGETYILDSYFWVLYSKWGHLFPSWFKDRIRL